MGSHEKGIVIYVTNYNKKKNFGIKKQAKPISVKSSYSFVFSVITFFYCDLLLFD